jgi:glycosyltransferase involved in cell wall biosynthesis
MQPVGHGATMIRFTILTATFNRAHTLSRVFHSLSAQTFTDFEWLIVDDASTDGTQDLVATWKAFFPIRYIRIPHRGKHGAINAGVAVAAGEFIVIFDDDDACEAAALSRFDYHWRQIPNPAEFSTLSVLCRDPDGNICGKPFPSSPVDATNLRELMLFSGNAERWAMVRTDVLRQFPYPEGEPYVMEGLVWNRMMKHYKVRLVNEPLRILYPTPGSITTKGRELLTASPKATLRYFFELATSSAPIGVRLKSAANVLRFCVLSLPRMLLRN